MYVITSLLITFVVRWVTYLLIVNPTEYSYSILFTASVYFIICAVLAIIIFHYKARIVEFFTEPYKNWRYGKDVTLSELEESNNLFPLTSTEKMLAIEDFIRKNYCPDFFSI